MTANTAIAEKMLTVPEVAERLGVSERTIRHWIGQGHFPGARRSGPNRRSPFIIPVADIEAFEAQHR
jgi:excisionase family DNA binding protein